MSDGQISITLTRKLAADMTSDAATKTAVLDALRRVTIGERSRRRIRTPTTATRRQE